MRSLVVLLVAAAASSPVSAEASVDVSGYRVRCDSASDDSKPFASAVQRAAAEKTTLTVSCRVRIASGSIQVAVPLRFEKQGAIEFAGGTLAVSGPVAAPLSQIFYASDGSLSVTSASVSLVPQWFGAVADGKHDDGPAFQAVSAAVRGGGTIKVPAGRYRFSCSGASVDAPKVGLNIKAPDVRVLGTGATIFMDDFTRATANAIADRRGADVCTAVAFQKTHGGRVEGLRFEGLADGTPLVNLRSRAKGIGITDSKGIRVVGVSGYGIVGNVVNARGSAAVDSTENVVVTDSYAERCSENGFNFMGGTSHMVLANTVSRDNGFHGAEFGSEYVTVTNCVFTGNKTGVSQVGRYGTFTNNILSNNRLEGFNFQWNDARQYDGSHNKVTHNTIVGNGSLGVGASAMTHDNEISDNVILNNGDQRGRGEGIKLAPGCHDFGIYRNWIGNGPSSAPRYTIFGIDIVGSKAVKVSDNEFLDLGKFAVLTQGDSEEVQLSSNRTNVKYSVSARAGSKVWDSEGATRGSEDQVSAAMHPPRCDSKNAGQLWTPQLPVGVRQPVYVCAATTASTYEWRRLY